MIQQYVSRARAARGKAAGATVVFIIFGAVAATLGSVDVANRAAGFHARLVGLLFLVAGVLMVMAGCLLPRNSSHPERMSGEFGKVSLIAAVAGIALGGYLCFALRASGKSFLAQAAAFSMTLIFSWIFVRLLRLGAVATVKTGALIVGVLGVFSVYQFWFTQQYLPAVATGIVNLTTSLEPGGTLGGRPSVIITIGVSSTSPTRVNVLASSYSLTIQRMLSSEDDSLAARGAYSDINDPPPAVYAPKSPDNRGLLWSGRVFGDGYFIGSGEVVTRQWVARLPRYAWGDVIRLQASLVEVNAAQLQPELGPSSGPELIDKTVAIRYEFDQPSVIQRWLVGEDRSVLIYYHLEGPVPFATAGVVRSNLARRGTIQTPEQEQDLGIKRSFTTSISEILLGKATEAVAPESVPVEFNS